MMKTITGLLFAMFFLSACNTIHGMRGWWDIQRGGEKVKDAATSVQQNCNLNACSWLKWRLLMRGCPSVVGAVSLEFI